MKPAVPDAASRPRNRFWPFSWVTILVLLAVYVYAELGVGKLRTDALGRVALSPHVVPQWDRVIGEILAHHDIRLNDMARGEIDALIEMQIDKAFEPVYGQIPSLADFH